MKSLSILFCFILSSGRAQEFLVVWDEDYKCIVNQIIFNETPTDILKQIGYTLKPKDKSFYGVDSLGNSALVFPMQISELFVYVGKEIDKKTIQQCSEYMKASTEQDNESPFFQIDNEIWYLTHIADTITSEESYKNSHIYKLTTKLPNGKWYKYAILRDKALMLTKELTIENGAINGYMNEYSRYNGCLQETSKYLDGVLVDTLTRYTEGYYVQSREIRSNNGLNIYNATSYYYKTNNVFWYIDYIIGYDIAFYEDGNLFYVVKIKNNNRTGVYIEFGEAGNILQTKFYAPRSRKF